MIDQPTRGTCRFHVQVRMSGSPARTASLGSSMSRDLSSRNSVNDRGMPETNIRTDARLQMENVGVPSRTRVVRRGDSPLRHSSEWCLTR